MNRFIKIIPALILFMLYSPQSSLAQERILFADSTPVINEPELEKYFQDLSSVLKKESKKIILSDNKIPEQISPDTGFVIQDINDSKIAPFNSIKSIEEAYKKYNSLEHYIKGNTLLESAFMQLDKPYQWGKMGPDGFDCSGFTQYVFKISGITIPRTSEQQSKDGKSIEKTQLEPGDLIFFDTRNISDKQDITDQPYLVQYNDSPNLNIAVSEDGLSNLLNVMLSATVSSDISVSKPFVPEKVTHVGIFIGDNKFIHASSGGKKVIVSDITSNYYKTRFLNAKRYN